MQVCNWWRLGTLENVTEDSGNPGQRDPSKPEGEDEDEDATRSSGAPGCRLKTERDDVLLERSRGEQRDVTPRSQHKGAPPEEADKQEGLSG